jgi:hypothetical protein
MHGLIRIHRMSSIQPLPLPSLNKAMFVCAFQLAYKLKQTGNNKIGFRNGEK